MEHPKQITQRNKPRSDAPLLLGDDRLGLVVGLGQLLETRLHLVEVLDLLRVPD